MFQTCSSDLPRNRLIVFTGLSGSGKSTLAFDTLYAEGQRELVRIDLRLVIEYALRRPTLEVTVANQMNKKYTTVDIGKGTFRAEVADTDETRARGLGGRQELGKSEGMLFVTEKDGDIPIWDVGNSTSIDDNSFSSQLLFFIASCDFDDFIGKEMSFRIDDVNTSTTDCCVVLPVETASYSILLSHDLVKSQAFFSCDKQGFS